MSTYYEFYNPNNGKRIDGGAYAGMPFFNDNVEEYGIEQCAIKVDYHKCVNEIKNWTRNKNSALFKNYYNFYDLCWTSYITRECAEKMQKDMTFNETLFTDLMDENNCDALIMDVSY